MTIAGISRNGDIGTPRSFPSFRNVHLSSYIQHTERSLLSVIRNIHAQLVGACLSQCIEHARLVDISMFCCGHKMYINDACTVEYRYVVHYVCRHVYATFV
jgi:hypothetical protein